MCFSNKTNTENKKKQKKIEKEKKCVKIIKIFCLHKIFYSFGDTNNDPTNKILDRMALTSNHNSYAKMWMQVLLGQIKGLFYRSHYPSS